MSNSITISFDLSTTDSAAGLGFEVWIDTTKLYDEIVNFNSSELKFEISDDTADHELRFIMKNKTVDHTKLGEDGNIVSDAKLILKNLAFDEIKLGHLATEQAVYTHNFNGTGREAHEKFYEEIGCNGTVSLKFSTPIYLWLLEHM
jgi:hypothetical protein